MAAARGDADKTTRDVRNRVEAKSPTRARLRGSHGTGHSRETGSHAPNGLRRRSGGTNGINTGVLGREDKMPGNTEATV